jgi:hypothetical protein
VNKERRVKEVSSWDTAEKAKYVGVSVTRWRTMTRAQRLQAITQAVAREKE